MVQTMESQPSPERNKMLSQKIIDHILIRPTNEQGKQQIEISFLQGDNVLFSRRIDDVDAYTVNLLSSGKYKRVPNSGDPDDSRLKRIEDKLDQILSMLKKFEDKKDS